METLNFNTQICTTVEQSKRLLELGLKPETSDMLILPLPNGKELIVQKYEDESENLYYTIKGEEWESSPAWSLHRLITMLPLKIEDDYATEYFLKIEGSNIVYKERDIFIYNSFEGNNVYDNIIDCIEWFIKYYYFYFNRDYLK